MQVAWALLVRGISPKLLKSILINLFLARSKADKEKSFSANLHCLMGEIVRLDKTDKVS